MTCKHVDIDCGWLRTVCILVEDCLHLRCVTYLISRKGMNRKKMSARGCFHAIGCQKKKFRNRLINYSIFDECICYFTLLALLNNNFIHSSTLSYILQGMGWVPKGYHSCQRPRGRVHFRHHITTSQG